MNSALNHKNDIKMITVNLLIYFILITLRHSNKKHCILCTLSNH